MYKHLFLFSLALFLVAGGVFYYKLSEKDKRLVALSNEVAKLEKTVKEKEGVWSARGVELENLKSSSKDLQRTIDKRDEEILATAKVALRWKDLYLKIANAPVTPVAPDGTTTVVVSADCINCLKDLRLRVDFEQSTEYLTIKGHTLTNPGYAEVAVNWIKSFNLYLILTKDENDKFRVYLDDSGNNIVAPILDLKVDPSIFEESWYEKVGVGADLLLGDAAALNVRAFYQIGSFMVGPAYQVSAVDGEMIEYYGISGGWFPLR